MWPLRNLGKVAIQDGRWQTTENRSEEAGQQPIPLSVKFTSIRVRRQNYELWFANSSNGRAFNAAYEAMSDKLQ